MIITTTIATLLIGLVLQSIAFAYFMGKLRTDVDVLQNKFKEFDQVNIQIAELRKELQFLLAPRVRHPKTATN